MFSFFTRNLARLAPPVVALLRQHGQPVDPNLQRLADAYATIATKLDSDALVGLDVAADGDEVEERDLEYGHEHGGVPLVAEDAQEGLARTHHVTVSGAVVSTEEGLIKRKRCDISCQLASPARRSCGIISP